MTQDVPRSHRGFRGRGALVTGGRRGIGFAFARELASRGCHVAITTRDPSAPDVAERLRALAEVAPRDAPAARAPLAIAWDMTAAGADVAAARALEAAGHTVELLVHAAHVFSSHKLIVETKPEALARSLEHNVAAPYALVRRLTRTMARARFGRVLFVSSLAAALGGVGQVIYVAEKSALEGLTRAFAAELGSRDVLVNAIAPGIVDTEHVREAVRPEVAQAFAERSALGRLATPEEVAIAAMSLLDPDQRSVNGQVLRIADGSGRACDVAAGIDGEIDGDG